MGWGGGALIGERGRNKSVVVGREDQRLGNCGLNVGSAYVVGIMKCCLPPPHNPVLFTWV